ATGVTSGRPGVGLTFPSGARTCSRTRRGIWRRGRWPERPPLRSRRHLPLDTWIDALPQRRFSTRARVVFAPLVKVSSSPLREVGQREMIGTRPLLVLVTLGTCRAGSGLLEATARRLNDNGQELMVGPRRVARCPRPHPGYAPEGRRVPEAEPFPTVAK